MNQLYDASALCNILLHRDQQYHRFQGQAVLDLTKYELGNATQKQYGKADKESIERLLNACVNLADDMYVLDMRGMELDVVMMGISAKLTFYDSAYVVVARQYGLDLVTDDGDMLAAARSNGIVAVRSDEV